MNALTESLRSTIRREGPLTIAQYMTRALGDPCHGYYMRRAPFGRNGDFITAPEISQIFGELVALFLIHFWEQAGAPKRFHLIELGPGRGTLISDFVRTAARFNAFYDAMLLHLVEFSPRLRDQQKHALAAFDATRLKFHETPLSLPKDAPLLLIGNEFLDALPIHQFIKKDGVWRERLITLDEAGNLGFTLAATAMSDDDDAPEGSFHETCPEAQKLAIFLAERFHAQGGFALFIDYGYARPTRRSTFSAISHHEHVDVLATPGEADLSAHVDFQTLNATAQKAGARVYPVIDQRTFLENMGIAERTAQLIASHPERAVKLEEDKRRLINSHQNGMGALFKASCFAYPYSLTLPAFGAPISQ